MRALGRVPDAEFRANQLRVHDQPVGIATPYLIPDSDDANEVVARGIYDSIGVRLRYSDAKLFAETEPTDVVARIVFDMLEQIRCESLIPDELTGTKQNVEASFRRWCRSQRLSETALGLLIYTVMHMARSRLVAPIHDELIEDQIEATRANISPIIGTALLGLRTHRYDQAEFAVAARSLADAVSEMVTESTRETDLDTVVEQAVALTIPVEWSDLDIPEGAGAPTAPLRPPDGDESLETIGGYTIWSTAYDEVVQGGDLYPEKRRRFLRGLLNEQIAAQSVSAFTLARRLRILLRGIEQDGWSSGEEEGLLDASRLGQVVANPGNHAVFRQERYRPTAPAVVSFLIDNSGSMKRQRHETIAVLVDTLARALDLAGATSEILGFSTATWNGGEPRNEWRREGQPDGPGRLAETSHIIYKDADTPWKRSRLAVASLMRTQHFRESVDGEAIIWAYERLLARPEQRKLLVVVSDGAPTEASTRYANGNALLEDHLRNVTQHIQRRGLVQLGAISVDQPVDAFFDNSVDMDLTGTLTLSDYRLLERLFSAPR